MYTHTLRLAGKRRGQLGMGIAQTKTTAFLYPIMGGVPKLQS